MGQLPTLLTLVRIAIIAGLQALVAAILEERYALFGDEHGFRNNDGKFVPKWYAHARTLLGVCIIAFGVKGIAIVSNVLFDSVLVQGFGLGLILTPPLVHTISDNYQWGAAESLSIIVGVLLILAGYIG